MGCIGTDKTDARDADQIAQTRRARMAPFREFDDPTDVSNMFRSRCRCGAPRSRRRNVCELDDPIKPHRNIRTSSRCSMRTVRIRSHAYPVFRIGTMLAQTIRSTDRSSKTCMKNAVFPLHRENRLASILIVSVDSADMESDGNRFVSIYSTPGTPRTGRGSR